MSRYTEFLTARLGNYVVVRARRKEPRYDRQGNLQNQVLSREMAAVEREYRALYGDPYDAVRAELYMTLRELMDDPAVRMSMSFRQFNRAEAALRAEVER